MNTVLQILAQTDWGVPVVVVTGVVALLVLLMAVAAGVALFHPDPGRRKDARAVLNTLVPRRRR